MADSVSAVDSASTNPGGCTKTELTLNSSMEHVRPNETTSAACSVLAINGSPPDGSSRRSSSSNSSSGSLSGSQTSPKTYKRRPKLPKRSAPLTKVCDISEISPTSDYEDFVRLDKDTVSDIAILYHAFKHCKKLIAVVGAGISVAAGIPDFRSKEGLFQTLKQDLKLPSTGKAMFDASSVYQDEKSIKNFQATIHNLHRLCQKSEPTEFHSLLSKMSQDNRLLRVYSQNIDDLDTHLPGLGTKVPLTKPWPKTIQLHGSINKMVCSRCHWCGPLDPGLFENSDGHVPECPECTEMDSVRVVAGKRSQGIGRLRPRIVLYNDTNADSEAIGAVTEVDLKSKPDALAIVGTTLKIPGVRRIVKEMSQAVHAANGPVIWVNTEDTAEVLANQFEGCFDLFVKGDCQAIPRLLDLYEYHQQKLLEEKALKKAEAKLKAEKRRQAQTTLGFKVVRNPNARKRIKMEPKWEHDVQINRGQNDKANEDLCAFNLPRPVPMLASMPDNHHRPDLKFIHHFERFKVERPN